MSASSTAVTDLHLWRLGPGHPGAIVAIATEKRPEAKYYHRTLGRFGDLSRATVEVNGRLVARWENAKTIAQRGVTGIAPGFS